MLPRNKIIPLYEELSFEENLNSARVSRHTRFPLCRNNLDHIIGMVHIKDLLWQARASAVSANIENIRRDILFIPEFVSLETLLTTFLEKRCHMAIIVDEFGGTLGMVTLEDVLEELVGEIQDEFDQELPLIHQTSENEFLIDGSTPLHDVEEVFGIQLSNVHDATTLGGYVTHRYGDIPAVGARWTYGNLKFSVEKTDKLRVSQIRIKKLRPKTSPSPQLSGPAA
jgi:CBS domain containing-hemolysin-like protein